MFGLVGVSHGGVLSKNFYNKSCPLAEDIVKNVTWKNVALNPTFSAKFFLMHFHDCFVRVGGHTIGVGHCNFFSNRLYNFTGKGDADPLLNSKYATTLRAHCRSLSDNATTVGMDPGSVLSFDSNYYTALKPNKGMFQSDAALLTTSQSKEIVDELVEQRTFFAEFAQSMKRMGAIEVLTGTAGEIRKNNVVNS